MRDVPSLALPALTALCAGESDTASIPLRVMTEHEDHTAIQRAHREHNEQQLKALVTLHDIWHIEAVLSNREITSKLVQQVTVKTPQRILNNFQVLDLHHLPVLTLGTTVRSATGPSLCVVQSRQVTLLQLIQLLAIDAVTQADIGFFEQHNGHAIWCVVSNDKEGTVSLEITKMPANYVVGFQNRWPLGTNKVKP